MQLVAVQMTLDISDYFSPEAFHAKVDALMQEVKSRLTPGLPALVVFPEDVGLMLVLQGLHNELVRARGIEDAVRIAVRRFLFTAGPLRLLYGLDWIPALFFCRHRAIASTYFRVFSETAKKYGVYIVGGSAALPPYKLSQGQVLWQHKPTAVRVHNSSFLFGPDGSVLGRQDKVHLLAEEGKGGLGLTPGEPKSITAFDTELGRIGIAICFDAFHDDVIETLWRKGAEILVQPSANPLPWSPEQQLDWTRGSYRVTYDEGRFAYAVNPMLNGRLWELSFYGQSSIVARNNPANPGLHYTDLDPMPGLAAVAATDSTEEILVVTVKH